MATTSTNKQPLLVDRVFHFVVDTNNAFSSTFDVSGTNNATLLVNAIATDGATVESVYAISRGGAAEDINLYLSRADDYLRPNEATPIGKFTSSATEAEVTEWEGAPKILAPVPAASDGDAASPTGAPLQFRALYVPKGFALWVARQATGSVVDGPFVGAQGGWY
jgi:hypothetical protein